MNFGDVSESTVGFVSYIVIESIKFKHLHDHEKEIWHKNLGIFKPNAIVLFSALLDYWIVRGFIGIYKKCFIQTQKAYLKNTTLGIMNIHAPFASFVAKLVCHSESLQWGHNEHDCVQNHRRLGCLCNIVFRRKSKKTSKPVTREMFPFDDVIMVVSGSIQKLAARKSLTISTHKLKNYKTFFLQFLSIRERDRGPDSI